MAEFIMTGIKSLDKKLDRLDRKTRNRVARSALSKGASVGAKAVKKEIPSLQKDVRKAIGHSTKKRKSSGFVTVSQFGTTGKRSASVKKKRSASGGVGISKENVHWYLMGTKQRFHKSGKSTGKMPSNNAVATGAKKAKPSIIKAINERAAAVLAREVKKSGG